MFVHQFVASFINKYLQKYADILSVGDVNISISRRCVTLVNIEIGPIAFKQSFNITYQAVIQSVLVKFPWGFLYNRKCEVTINNPHFFFSAAPKGHSKVFDGSTIDDDGPSGTDGFIQKRLLEILENLQIEVLHPRISLVDNEGYWEGRTSVLSISSKRLYCGEIKASQGISQENWIGKNIEICEVECTASCGASSACVIKPTTISSSISVNLTKKKICFTGIIECINVFFSPILVETVQALGLSFYRPHSRVVSSVVRPLARPIKGTRYIKDWWIYAHSLVKWYRENSDFFFCDQFRDNTYESEKCYLSKDYARKFKPPWVKHQSKCATPPCSIEVHSECGRVEAQYSRRTELTRSSNFSEGQKAFLQQQSSWNVTWSLQTDIVLCVQESIMAAFCGLKVSGTLDEGQIVDGKAYIHDLVLLKDNTQRTTAEENAVSVSIQLVNGEINISGTARPMNFNLSSKVVQKIANDIFICCSAVDRSISWPINGKGASDNDAETATVKATMLFEAVVFHLDDEVEFELVGVEILDSISVESVILKMNQTSLLTAIKIRVSDLKVLSISNVTLRNELEKIEALKKRLVLLSKGFTGDQRHNDQRLPFNWLVVIDEVGFECVKVEEIQIAVELGVLGGWKLSIDASGISTPTGHCSDAQLQIMLWADEYLQISPFANDIEPNGIGFVISFSNMTLTLNDQMLTSLEAIYDITMLLLFWCDDSHVYLRDNVNFMSHISGQIFVGKSQLTIDECHLGNQVLPAVVISAPTFKSVDISLRRSSDKFIQVNINLHDAVTCFLRDVIAPIELLPFRKGGKVSVAISMSGPPSSQLTIFPFSRLKIDVSIYRRAVVPHIPTVMALWRHFDTAGTNLARLRSLPSRIHFSSLPSRNRSIPLRSNNSSFYFTKGSLSSNRSQLPPENSSLQGLYSTAVFPTDLVLSVTGTDSVVYYPWGEGDDSHSTAPMYLYTPARRFHLLLTSRAALTRLEIDAMCDIPRVRCSTHHPPLDDPTVGDRSSQPTSNEMRASVKLVYTFDRRSSLNSTISAELPAEEQLWLSISGSRAVEKAPLYATFSPSEVGAIITLLTADRYLDNWKGPGVQPNREKPPHFSFRLRIAPVIALLPCLGLSVVFWDGISYDIKMCPTCYNLSFPRLSVLFHESVAQQTGEGPGANLPTLRSLAQWECDGYSLLQLDSGKTPGDPSFSCSFPSLRIMGTECTLWHFRSVTLVFTEEILVTVRNIHGLHYLRRLIQLSSEQRRSVEAAAEQHLSMAGSDKYMQCSRVAEEPQHPATSCYIILLDSLKVTLTWLSVVRAHNRVSAVAHLKSLQFGDSSVVYRNPSSSTTSCGGIPLSQPENDERRTSRQKAEAEDPSNSQDGCIKPERVLVLEEGEAGLFFYEEFSTNQNRGTTLTSTGPMSSSCGAMIPLLHPFRVEAEMVQLPSDSAKSNLNKLHNRRVRTISKLSPLHVDLTIKSYLLVCEGLRLAHVLVTNSLKSPNFNAECRNSNKDGVVLDALLNHIGQLNIVIGDDPGKESNSQTTPAIAARSSHMGSSSQHIGIDVEELRLSVLEFVHEEKREMDYWGWLRQECHRERVELRKHIRFSREPDARFNESVQDPYPAVQFPMSCRSPSELERIDSCPWEEEKLPAAGSGEESDVNRENPKYSLFEHYPAALPLHFIHKPEIEDRLCLEFVMGSITYIHDNIVSSEENCSTMPLWGLYVKHIRLQFKRRPPLIEMTTLSWHAGDTTLLGGERKASDTTAHSLSCALVESVCFSADPTVMSKAVELLLEYPSRCLAELYSNANSLLAIDSGANRLRHLRQRSWSLSENIRLARRHSQGELLYFSNAETNHMTVFLGDYTITVDPSLHTHPSVRSSEDQAVILIDSGLTVTFVGGTVELPSQSLPLSEQERSQERDSLEFLLMPYVMLGEGSYIKCKDVRCVFSVRIDRAELLPTPVDTGISSPARRPAVKITEGVSFSVNCISIRLGTSTGDLLAQPTKSSATLSVGGSIQGEWRRERRHGCTEAATLRVEVHGVEVGTTRSSPEVLWSTGDTTIMSRWEAELKVNTQKDYQGEERNSSGVRGAVKSTAQSIISLGNLNADVTYYDVELIVQLQKELRYLWDSKKHMFYSSVEREFFHLVEELELSRGRSGAFALPAQHVVGDATESRGEPNINGPRTIVVWSPSFMIRLSNHRAPLLAIGGECILGKAETHSASLQQESIRSTGLWARVFGKGGWDDVLKPNAAVSWKRTITPSSYHTVCQLDDVKLHTSLVVLSKVLYVARQLEQLPCHFPQPAGFPTHIEALGALEGNPHDAKGDIPSPSPLSPSESGDDDKASLHEYSGQRPLYFSLPPSIENPVPPVDAASHPKRFSGGVSHSFTNGLDKSLFLFLFPLRAGSVPQRFASIAEYEIVEVEPMASVNLSVPYKRGKDLYLCLLPKRCVGTHQAAEGKAEYETLRKTRRSFVMDASNPTLSHVFFLNSNADSVLPVAAGIPLKDLQYGAAKGLVLDGEVIALSCTEDFYETTRRARSDIVYAPSVWDPEGKQRGEDKRRSPPWALRQPQRLSGKLEESPRVDADVIHVRIHAKITLRNETGHLLFLSAGTLDKEAPNALESVTVGSGEYFSVYNACSSLCIRVQLRRRVYEATLILETAANSSFLSLMPHPYCLEESDKSDVDGSSLMRDNTYDQRPLVFYVVVALVTNRTCTDIILLPRVTFINAVGVPVALTLWQTDPLAGPLTSTEREMREAWNPRGNATSTSRKPLPPDLVLLGAHHNLEHEEALCISQCTYASNLYLGIRFTQVTGERIEAPGAILPVCSEIRHTAKAPGALPVVIPLEHGSGRRFYLIVTIRQRTITLSVAMWACNMTNYPLLLSDHWLSRQLLPGLSESVGIPPSRGTPFLLGVLLHRLDHAFMKIGLDGEWSAVFDTSIGAGGVIESRCERLNVVRSCNYTVYFPNATAHQPAVMLFTPRWVFCNLTTKRLRIHLDYAGLEKAKKSKVLRNADPQRESEEADRVAAVKSMSTLYLKPNDYHVSCVGPRKGNRISLEEDLAGIVPTVSTLEKEGTRAAAPVSSFYHSQRTETLSVDSPGEGLFNLWAVPSPPQPQLAAWNGVTLTAYAAPNISPPNPLASSSSGDAEEFETDSEYSFHCSAAEELAVFDPSTSLNAAITGRLVVSVSHTHDNVLIVSIRPVVTTKISIQNRTLQHTVVVRQQGSVRRSTIPSCQNRYFCWEEASGAHVILVHLLSCKGSWYKVDLTTGECQVHFEEQPSVSCSPQQTKDPRRKPFYVHALTNRRKTQVTVIVTAENIPDCLLRLQQPSLSSAMTVVKLSSLECSFHLRGRMEEPQRGDRAKERDAPELDFSYLTPSWGSAEELDVSQSTVTLLIHDLHAERLDAENTQNCHLRITEAQVLQQRSSDEAPYPIAYRAQIRNSSATNNTYRAAVLNALLSRLSTAFVKPQLFQVHYNIVKYPDGMRRLTEGTAELAPLVLSLSDLDLAQWIGEVLEAQRFFRLLRLQQHQRQRKQSKGLPHAATARPGETTFALDSLHPDLYLSYAIEALRREAPREITGGTLAGQGHISRTTYHRYARKGRRKRPYRSAVPDDNWMIVDRLEVSRLSLFLSFTRHGSDPLRPLLGSYTLMLPNQLEHTEFTLRSLRLFHQMETIGSLKGQLRQWCRSGLREQWTKMTKLGTLVDILKRTGQLPLQPRPPVLRMATSPICCTTDPQSDLNGSCSESTSPPQLLKPVDKEQDE